MKNMQIKKEVLMVGNVNYRNLITFLFYVGLIPILYWSYIFGEYVKMKSFISKTVLNPDGMYSSIQANNIMLGLFAGILFGIVWIVFWKTLCEFLYLIFRVLENKSNDK